MRRTARLGGLLLLAACTSNPAPGEPGYPYNLSGLYEGTFVVQGIPHTGSVQLATGAGGAVTGSFEITDPQPVTGTVAGTLAGEDVAMRMEYFVARAGCGGTAEVRGSVARGGGLVTGTISTDDDCAGRSTGALTLRKD